MLSLTIVGLVLHVGGIMTNKGENKMQFITKEALEELGDRNSGNFNSGYKNSGDLNSGYKNSGDLNSGDRNSGNFNSGYKNSGDLNSGDLNSGDLNSGYKNSGCWNSGDRNSGNFNSGYKNSGDLNSGDLNSGDWNSCSRESGFFNSRTSEKVRVFNKLLDRKTWENSEKPNFIYNIKLTYWVNETEMTVEDKKKDQYFYVRGGQLKTRTYKEAWEEAYKNATEEDIKLLKALPNFDADVFEEITGIRVD